jgi:hypothetical protein
MECVAFENERLSEKVIAVISRMARVLAARNQCPSYSPFANFPGAYRAEDLPICESSGEAAKLQIGLPTADNFQFNPGGA